MVSDCDILDDINSSNNSCILEGGTVENNPLYDGITFGTHDDLTINRHSWGNNESLNSSRLTGYVDELRISNSIRYHDNFTPPSAQFHNDSNTIGLWNFNEGSGDTVYDISGNENHGILYGAEHSPTLINVDGFGEMYYAGAFNNSYYYYTFSNTFDWSSANVNAAALNASLLDITPPNEINFITPQLFDGFNYWISNNQLINANGDLVTGDGLHDVIIETSVMLGTHPTSAANGCTNPIADNYTVTAQIEDGSCLYSSLVYEDLTELNSDLAEDLSVFEAIEEEQNYSMSFDSNEYVNLFGNEDFNFGIGDFTISLWFKSLVTESFENTLEILGKRPISWTGNNNYYYDIQLSSSGLTSYNVPYTSEPSVIFHWNSEPHPGAFHAYSPFNLLDEQWHYLTVSKEGILLKVFLNGVLVSEQDRFPTENQTADNDGPLLIGNYAGSNHAPFLLESINIWDEAIESTTIQYHMTCPPTGEEEGLVGYWKFNESIGDTVYDLSGNGNHGVIYGGATFSTDVPESYSGCTDELALNYDETALCDNGSCVYVDEIISNLEDVISTVNSELDNTVSSLNDVIDTWQSSIDLTNESLDAISGISQMLNSFNSVIDLSEGWNMIGYGCPEPMDVEESLSDYTDLILIAKANNGSAYLPEYGFNGIGDFTPGYGYQLKTSESIEEFSLCYSYTVIDNTQITEIVNDNAQMQNDVNCLTGNPQIGDYCYGGIVFYVAEGTEGKYGLVASELILEGASDPYNNGFNGFEWGCHQEYTQGVNLKLIGSGKLNTLNIDGQNCASENGGIIAAIATLNFEIESYLDWYLPSIDELVEMEEAIGNIGLQSEIDTVTNNWYWSSTQYNDDFYYAEYVDFGNNGSYQNLKYSSGRVRAIRYFGNWTKGCMDSLACNYNLDASMADGSCEYADEGYDCDGNELHISMSFDGVFDNVQTNNSNSIDVNHSISIGFSIKPNTWNTGDENCIVSKKSSDNSNGFVVYNDANTTPRITLRLKGSLTEFPGGIDFTSNSPVDIDEWQSWFFVYDTTTSIAKIYKNGILDTTYYSINNVGDMSNSSDLYFGLPQHPSWNGFYDGLLYDVSIWEVALDQFQIQSFFNCSLNGNEEGLVGYWKFNEGEGSIVNDSSGKGNHGTINGASYSTDIPEHNCE